MSEELRAIVLEELARVAPDADLGALEDDDPIRDELDIDSMDFLRFVQGLHRRTGVAIPEIDYPRLAALEDVLAYLERSGATARSAGS